MKCISCGKEFEGRKSRKFCDTSCRVKFARTAVSVTKIVPIRVSVTENGVSVTEPEVDIHGITFRKEQSIEERIGKYLDLVEGYRFVPSWILHGYLSRNEACLAAVKRVDESKKVKSHALI
jgi:hypothetical protein